MKLFKCYEEPLKAVISYGIKDCFGYVYHVKTLNEKHFQTQIRVHVLDIF